MAYARRLALRCMLSAASIAALLVPASASALVTRQPYLQSVTPTSAVVMWQTDLATGNDSRVIFGTSLGTLDRTANAVSTTTPAEPTLRNHAVLLTGLQPDTTYYYAAGTVSGGVEAGGTPDHYVRTAPPAGTPHTFAFMAFGDSGNLSAEQAAVRDEMLARASAGAPRFMLHLGDMAYDTGTTEQFTDAVFAVYEPLLRKLPFWPSVGNHEASIGESASATQSGPYFDAFTLPAAGQAGGVASGTEAYYAFDHGQAHFVMLDGDDSSTAPGSPQLLWLADDLASLPSARQWVIAAFHHPPYSRGGHHSDNPADSGGRMIRMRENVAPILEAGGADLVLSGHSHSYERSYLIDRAYGYGTAPAFATPSFAVLQAGGRILDAGMGSYTKEAGVYPHGGTVYVVAGHGGAALEGDLDHPVMRYSELEHGFCLVSVTPTTLTLQNIRADGSVADTFSLTKPLLCSSAAQCADADACTTDTCSAGRCVNTPRQCPDGQACQPASGTCACVPGACNDADACTLDACHAVTGCGYTTVDCDDDDACTADGCAAASGCTRTAVSCADDGNACTTEACDPSLGCVSSPRTGGCDDAQMCTTGDRCQAGACLGDPVDCSAHEDGCNTGACNAVTGACESLPVGDGIACQGGHCMAGLCIADPPPPVDAGADAGRDAGVDSDVDASSAGGTGGTGGVDAGSSGPADAAVAGPDAATTGSSGRTAEPADAATPIDAAFTDGATALDAGISDGGSDHAAEGSGCACSIQSRGSTGRSAQVAGPLLALALRAARRRRRGTRA